MQIKYHTKTLELLSLDKIFNTDLLAVQDVELNNINQLPDSVYEFSWLHKALKWGRKLEWMKQEAEILQYYSNDDHYWMNFFFEEKILDEEIINYDGKKLLKFSSENQNNFDYAIELDEISDPAVYYSDYKKEKWMPYIASYSDFVYCQIFDWQWKLKSNKYWEKDIKYYGKINFSSINEMQNAAVGLKTEPVSSFFWGDAMHTMYRFSESPTARLLVFATEGKVSGEITAKTRKEITALKKKLMTRK